MISLISSHPMVMMAKSNRFPVFLVLFVVFAAWLTVDASVPDALSKDCTWERKYNYRRPNTADFFYKSYENVRNEARCKELCAQRVVCNYANYRSKGGKCQLVPRRPFHRQFVTHDQRYGTWVMFAKNCPLDDYYDRRDDPREEFVMCRMERIDQALDTAYVYQTIQYMPNIENRDEAEWWCRMDPMCQGMSYKKLYSHFWLFYYKVVINTTASQGANMRVSIKNCQPSGSECLYTSYKNKVLTGQPYLKIQRAIYLTMFECAQRCEGNSSCYAAVATEGRRRYEGRSCKLYAKDQIGQMTPYRYSRRYTYRYSKTWLKNYCA